MAWVDDRIWCHPKFNGLSADAFRVYIHGLAYSAGFGTGGRLDREQQNLIGSDLKTRRELVRKLLWNTTKTPGEVLIHDWAEHNAKRDARRAADRERKRLARAKEREESAGQGADSPQDDPQDTEEAVRRTGPGQNSGPAHVDGSEGSEGSEEDQDPVPVTALYEDRGNGIGGTISDQDLEQLADSVLAEQAGRP